MSIEPKKVRSLFMNVRFVFAHPVECETGGRDIVDDLVDRLRSYLGTDDPERQTDISAEGNRLTHSLSIGLFADELCTVSTLVQLTVELASVEVKTTSLRH